MRLWVTQSGQRNKPIIWGRIWSGFSLNTVRKMKKEPFSARGIYEDLLKEVIFDLSLEDWVGKDREKHAVGQGFRMNNGLKTETSGLFRNWQSRRIENVPWWWNWDPAKEMENPGRYSKNCTRAIYGLKDSVTTPMETSEFPSELCQTLLLAKPI